MSVLRKAGTLLSNSGNLTLATSVLLQKEPMVAVILLNWNNAHFTAPCIRSLEKSDYSNAQILVVDNGSADGSPDALRKDFPRITLIRNDKNLGFAAGNNVGIRAALGMGAQYVLILNNDTEVDPELIRELVSMCEADDSIGISSPKMYFMNPPNLIWFAGSRVNLWTGSCKHVGYCETDHGQFDAITEPGFATGCCFLVRADLLKKLGGFEESFFIYSEDADFSLRCRKAGHRIVFNPRAKLWHKESGTMAKNARNEHRAKPTPLQHYLIARNGIFVVRRHASLIQKVVSYPICTLRVVKRLLERLLERDWDSARSLARALWEGFRTECSTPSAAPDNMSSKTLPVRDC
jgi:GT2 family glycosyltransferase